MYIIPQRFSSCQSICYLCRGAYVFACIHWFVGSLVGWQDYSKSWAGFDKRKNPIHILVLIWIQGCIKKTFKLSIGGILSIYVLVVGIVKCRGRIPQFHSRNVSSNKRILYWNKTNFDLFCLVAVRGISLILMLSVNLKCIFTHTHTHLCWCVAAWSFQ